MKKIIKVDRFTEDTMIKVINILLMIACICIFYGCTYYFIESVYSPDLDKNTYNKLIVIKEHEPEPLRKVFKEITGYTELYNAIISLPITYTTMEFEYCGRHYITAYCPEECGYRVYADGSDNFPAGWVTSSDTICHYSEDNSEATTCAIDRRYHNYGEYLWIDGKLYITEDTGPGVQGMWVDVFMPDYESMAAFGSHYSIVYSVSFVEHTSERRLVNELYDDFVLRTLPDNWLILRSGN